MTRILSFIITLLALFCTGLQNDFKPTVILISIDGYRADYFEKYPSPTIQMLANGGVRAKWMTPAFPSLTFPNHYTLVTGLNPQSNGIISNTIYDREAHRTFAMSKREEVTDTRWWLGEPIWVTAEKQGQKAAPMFWVGSEAEIKGVRPSYWQRFDDNFPNSERVDSVLKWLDLPVIERPTMLTLYFSDVDHAGHESGPDSENVRQAVLKVDSAIGRLVDGLKARKILDSVNIIIVSDHGMAAVDPRQSVIIDDYFDTSQAEYVVWGNPINIFAKPGMEDRIYKSLKSKLPSQIKAYRRKDVPSRFNYSRSERIGDIVIIADEGWTNVTRDRYRPVQPGPDGKVALRGQHGFDNRLESMRATFIGYGPSLKQGAVVDPFNNVDVYNILARILNLKPATNDGGSQGMDSVLRK